MKKADRIKALEEKVADLEARILWLQSIVAVTPHRFKEPNPAPTYPHSPFYVSASS